MALLLSFSPVTAAASRRLRIAGSTTLLPLAQSWKRDFVRNGSNVSVSVEGGGTGVAAARICKPYTHPDHVDIGMMSRAWREEEAVQLDDGYSYECVGTGIRVTQLAIGVDGLTLVVARGGAAHDCLTQPTMGGLTFMQLRWIFSNWSTSALESEGVHMSDVVPNDDGDGVKDWSDLSSLCADVPINVYGPGNMSGTQAALGNVIFECAEEAGHEDAETEGFSMCNASQQGRLQEAGSLQDATAFIADGRVPNCYMPSEDDNQIANWVLADGGGLAYFGNSYYLKLEGNLTVVPVADDRVHGTVNTRPIFVAPTRASIADGSYSMLSRILHMNVDNTAWQSAVQFLEHGFSSEGQGNLAPNGVVRLSTYTFTQTMQRVEQQGNAEADYVSRPPLTCAVGQWMQSALYENAHGHSKYNFTCVPCEPGTAKPYEGLAPCTPCAPGTYASSVGQSSCEFCGLGTFSLLGSSNCSPCPINEVAGEPGSGICIPCGAGLFTSDEGAASCLRCPVGTYRQAGIDDTCHLCSKGMTTQFMSATSVEDCACAEGSYLAPGASRVDGPCLPCKEGMTCPFGSAHDNFKSWSQDAAEPIPLLNCGYYSSWSEPLSVYRCSGAVMRAFGSCPGGPPDSCLGGSFGMLCTECPEGQVQGSGGCLECFGASAMLAPFLWLGMMLWVIQTYYVSNSSLTVNASIILSMCIVGSMVLSTFQVLSIFNDWQLDLPDSIRGLLYFCSITMLSPKVWAYECLLGHSAVIVYGIRCLVPFMLVAIVLGLFLLSRVAGWFLAMRELGWRFEKAFNTLGQVLQTVFIAIASIVTVPLQCFGHPNGESSVLLYPEVLCWTPDHIPLLVLSTVVALCFVVPFSAVCIWASFSVISRSTDGGAEKPRLRMFRWLLFRFRPDRWWWMNVFNCRQLLLAFSSSLPADEPHLQVVAVVTIFVVYGILQGYFWPWKERELNALEAFMNSIMAVMAVAMTGVVPASGNTELYAIIFFMLFFVLTVGIVYMVGLCTYYVWKRGSLWGRFGRSKVCGMGCSELAEAWASLCAVCRNMDVENLQAAIMAMNAFDRFTLVQACGALQATRPHDFQGCGPQAQRLVEVPRSLSDPVLEGSLSSRPGSITLGRMIRKVSSTWTWSRNLSPKCSSESAVEPPPAISMSTKCAISVKCKSSGVSCTSCVASGRCHRCGSITGRSSAESSEFCSIGECASCVGLSLAGLGVNIASSDRGLDEDDEDDEEGTVQSSAAASFAAVAAVGAAADSEARLGTESGPAETTSCSHDGVAKESQACATHAEVLIRVPGSMSDSSST